ncbi:DUF1819 family protein [Spirosoma validum]|uniref:DUF1819 family protein n=1 Tax=Spirosoma validum TaxID=2771355 RepID=A0A927GGL5_9BACT|nr:DUF1819 family protein [Spirosoma validum]MBD2757117.1 DUF1819 family protein [Spirosoma validum]
MYRLSFTAASFRLAESIRLAELYQQCADWQKVKQMAIAGDVLQLGRAATVTRESRELIHRLKKLADKEMDFLLHTDTLTQRQMILIAICRTYDFVRQFVLDVVRVNYQRFEFDISDSDYSRFFNQQAALHDELDELSDSSKAKIRQVLFQILAGAGYIMSTQQRVITQPVVLDTLADLIRQTRPADLPLLLFNDRDL